MRVPVLVECLEGSGYRATSLVPADLIVEAPTREEALAGLKAMVENRFAHGEIVHLEIPLPGEPHARMSLSGIWKDNLDIAEVEENIREYRRQKDRDWDSL